MARKSEPVTTDELATVIDEICDATHHGAQVADRLFKHLSDGEIDTGPEQLFALLNAQKDLHDLFHKVLTLHSQKLDRKELEAKFRAEMTEGNAG